MLVKEMDTRQVILDTAQELVARKGYSAVGLTEVLTAAGVPKGSFYPYFDSKDAFGEAMMLGYFDDYLANMDRIVAAPGRTYAERLMTYWQEFYDKQLISDCQGRCLVVKPAAEVCDLSESMRAVLKDGTAGIIDRVETMVNGGLEGGSVSIEGAPRLTADSRYEAWLGVSVLAKVNRNPGHLDRAMALTRQMLHL
ncbi:TetR/AcrR family transcriptional regulator [Actinacidiphila acididurans]|uniref:TetR/AcrR family transcriptional regulator n=1 Tax=Actinacidiphila acididurans TaxID=2784346 RepID=A0ABS2TJD6_9ACTN|nr:TetR/AcrR family transcriptional regulator [Actinacidiphila acididurans]MBM9503116.1 TetR/AcrR family transcriptional regulator [Actinacidiphila acididurans]